MTWVTGALIGVARCPRRPSSDYHVVFPRLLPGELLVGAEVYTVVVGCIFSASLQLLVICMKLYRSGSKYSALCAGTRGSQDLQDNNDLQIIERCGYPIDRKRITLILALLAFHTFVSVDGRNYYILCTSR